MVCSIYRRRRLIKSLCTLGVKQTRLSFRREIPGNERRYADVRQRTATVALNLLSLP